MAYRLVINGSRHIGQCVLQALYEHQRTDASFPSMTVVASSVTY